MAFIPFSSKIFLFDDMNALFHSTSADKITASGGVLLSKQIIASFPENPHDHSQCFDEAMDAAENLCKRVGLRLTAQRRRVLELLWTSHKPLGAYEILDMLNKQGAAAAPPTVYRALDFLLANGLIHRIESLNAFVGCAAPDQEHGGQFLICSSCGLTAELDDDDLTKKIRERASKMGFDVKKQTIEVSGLCPACRIPNNE